MKVRQSITGWLLGCIICCVPCLLYSQAPTYVWAKTILGNVESIQRSTAVDASGNVYLYGVFFGTVDFDPGPATVNVTPVPYGCNLYIAKYDAAGNYLWVKNIAINASYGGNCMSLDASGNIYITGFYSGTSVDFDPGAGIATMTSVSGSNDIFLAKYDANGNYVWVKSIGSTADDRGNEIITDAGGNIFIGGIFNGTVDFNPGGAASNFTAAGSGDIFFAKYDGNGNYLWAKQIGGASFDDLRDMVLDVSGNIFLTGSFYGTADFDPGPGNVIITSAGQNDIFFAKYDVGGNYLWSKEMGGTGWDIGSAVETDASGNAFVTGTFNGTVDFNPDLGTVNLTAATGGGGYFAKYDAAGNFQWANYLPLNTANMDMAIDLCGNLLIAGSFLSGGPSSIDMDPGAGVANLPVPGNLPPPYYNIFGEYDVNGNYLWAGVFGHTCYCSVAGYKSSISVDVNGYIYYSGIMNGGFFGSSTVDFDPGTGVANLTAPSSVDNTFFAKYICPVDILPIDLLSFTGKNFDHVNHLYWSTASEHQNNYFEIERSTGESSFETRGTIAGHENSLQENNYSFDDAHPVTGINYYRLKQVDDDGHAQYSDVIAVDNPPGETHLSISTIAPAVFVISGIEETPISVFIADARGRKVYYSNEPVMLSATSIRIELNRLSAGIYFATIITLSGYQQTQIPLIK